MFIFFARASPLRGIFLFFLLTCCSLPDCPSITCTQKKTMRKRGGRTFAFFEISGEEVTEFVNIALSNEFLIAAIGVRLAENGHRFAENGPFKTWNRTTGVRVTTTVHEVVYKVSERNGGEDAAPAGAAPVSGRSRTSPTENVGCPSSARRRC